MPPEIVALIDAPLSLIAVLFVGALMGMAVEQFVSKQKRAKWRRRNAGRWQKKGAGKAGAWSPRADPVPAKVPTAAQQLHTVMQAEFKAQPLLNKSEAKLFAALDTIVLGMRPGWQVMAQVSLGEILKCDDADAYRCINSKRVDFLLVDDLCKPIGAIEYQGGAHFKGAHATAARDAVKKEALRRADIGYEEIVAGHHTPADLRRVVERLVQRAKGG